MKSFQASIRREIWDSKGLVSRDIVTGTVMYEGETTKVSFPSIRVVKGEVLQIHDSPYPFSLLVV